MTKLSFLLISQRAIGTPHYSLKDLPGHGRFDIVARSLLQSSKKVLANDYNDFYCLMKGGHNTGWLSWQSNIPDEEDEVSISAIIQRDWQEHFTEGSLATFLNRFEKEHPNYRQILLSEKGKPLDQVELKKNSDLLIILGAQHDLIEEDLVEFSNLQSVSLGSQSMLASHAIAYFRIKWRLS